MERRTIKVKGKGFYCFKPDWLNINITIMAADTSYKKAMKYLGEKIGKLVDCITDIGLDPAKLVSCNIASDTINDYNISLDYEKYQRNGVKVSQKFKLGMPFEIAEIEKVVHVLLYCGISPELLLVQTVQDLEKLKSESIVAAVKESEKKARAMAQAVGATLGDVVSMEYKEKDMECECYVSQEFFDNQFLPITTGTLFGYNFLESEVEMTNEVEVVWEIK